MNQWEMKVRKEVRNRNFSALFSFDSLVFDAQRFGIATRNPHRS